MNTVFTQISAVPELAPPSIKHRTWDGKVNKRRSCGAALIRVLFVVMVKVLEGTELHASCVRLVWTLKSSEALLSLLKLTCTEKSIHDAVVKTET